MIELLGQKIRKARLDAGLTQWALSEQADMDVTHLKKIEKGLVKKPGIFQIFKISKILKTPLEYLLDDEIGFSSGSEKKSDAHGGPSTDFYRAGF